MTLSREQQVELKKTLDIWYEDPVIFVWEVFHVAPEKWQAEALWALTTNDKIAIKSGHGVGKTALLSWIIFWFLFLNDKGKVPCTAPTSSQLKDVLWRELGKWHRAIKIDELREMYEVTSEYVNCLDNKGKFAVARTARKEQPEAFQGFHETPLLLVIDEASGVEDIIFEVGQGALSTKGAKVIMCGNPTRRTGYFYRAFKGPNASMWYKMTVSSEESTQVDPAFVEDIAREYGKDSDVYRIRVLGEFPQSDTNTLIDADAVDRAMDCHMVKGNGKRLLGVDIARFGDDKTVLTFRHGRKVEKQQIHQKIDLMGVVGLIVNALKHEGIDKAFIDICGLGAGVFDRLIELGYRDYIVGVNAANKASNPTLYRNLRTEMWYNMKEWIESDIEKDLPDDDSLYTDLCEPRYSYDSSGRICLEKKEDMKKRDVDSPDRGDSLALTFAYPMNESYTKPKQPSTAWVK